MEESIVSDRNHAGHRYGSIDVGIQEAEDHPCYDDEVDHSRKTSLLKLISGFLVLLPTLLFLLGGNHKADAPFPISERLVVGKVEMLGKVYRSPSDTAYAYSQRVDHLDPYSRDTFQQRYYRKSEFFKGPGHPIILVVGGEGALDDGMFYPFIDTYLAERFGAYVLHPEHRFYGQSQPVDPRLLTNSDLKRLHTARQAMLDMLSIVLAYQERLGCSSKKTSKDYCPVIAVGGSYPGFLASIMRLHYPDIIDIGYGSSAPLLLYSFGAGQWGYMEKVTNVTDIASPGCALAVKKTLAEVDAAIRASDDYQKFAEDHLNVCPGTLPSYIDSNDMLSNEAMMVVEYTFANFNMGFYPPGENAKLTRICKDVFQNDAMDSFAKIKEFWFHVEDNIDPLLPCFDMSSQVPDGARGTISGSDWSGVGAGYDGMMFDFHCCSTLTPAIGFSTNTMFPYRKWTLEWLTEHCLDRFDVVPDPNKLLREFKFDDLVGQGATRILFTNGMHDLWSMGSYLESLSDSILVVNMPNGAHHSELAYMNEDGVDTEDVMKAHDEITNILESWIGDVKEVMKSGKK